MNRSSPNYWELLSLIKDVIPRRGVLEELEKSSSIVKEKGRKVNYRQYNLESGAMESHQRNLNLEEISSFLEISLRAPHCPLPLNMDLWDAKICSYNCVAKGQWVSTPKGKKKIEDISLGEEITTYNEETQRIERQKVLFASSSVRNDIIEIETETGTIRVTSDHLVYTRRGWISAQDLVETDEILEIE